jgi:acetyl esterase/lipase
MGSALYPPLFPPWLLTLAQSHSAIVVSPDYTLLPSPNGLSDITADIATFWKWLHESLPSILSERALSHSIDFSRILVHGGSAGGYLAASAALSHPREIRSTLIVTGSGAAPPPSAPQTHSCYRTRNSHRRPSFVLRSQPWPQDL